MTASQHLKLPLLTDIRQLIGAARQRVDLADKQDAARLALLLHHVFKLKTNVS